MSSIIKETDSAGTLIEIFRGIAGFVRPLIGLGPFVVRTPNAVASVRSTEWTVDTGDQGTAVFVRRGAVKVDGLGAIVGTVMLRSGYGVEVAFDGVVYPPGAWPGSRIAEMNSRLGYDWQ